MTRGVKSQTAFVAGEISPQLYGRTDLAKYHLGLKTLENFFVGYRGGVVSRPGTEWVGELHAHSAIRTEYDRLFRFRASGNDYVLVFSHERMYVVQNGAFVTNGTVNQTSMIGSSGGAVTMAYTGSTLVVGDIIRCTDGDVISGALNQFYIVTAIPSAGQATYQRLHWGSTGAASYTGSATGMVFEKLYSITTPWPREELEDLSFEQRYATAILTSVNEVPYRLTFNSATSWSLSAISFGASATAPGSVTLTKSGAGSAGAAFAVTAVVDGVESVASAYSIESAMVNYSTTAGEMKITWGAVSGVDYYNVYRSLIIATGADVSTDLEVGYIGRSVGETFVDTNIVADFTKSPPLNFNPFTSNNPKTFRIFQGRGVYAGTDDNPMTIYGSKPGDIDNFDVSNALNAGDAYTYTLDGPEVDPIQHLVALRRGLLVFTKYQISQLTSGDTTGVTALNAVLEPQAYVGAGAATPIAIAQDIIFAQEDGSSINAMMFTEFQDTFQMVDLTVLSNHMLSIDQPVKRFAWQKEPHKLLWALKSDGELLSCTYDRTQEVFGWARHSTDGLVRDIVSVREGGREVLYLLIERVASFGRRLYLERLKARDSNKVDMWPLDSALEVALNTGSGIIEFDALTGTGVTLEAETSGAFSSLVVGDRIYFRDAVVAVASLVSGTEITVDFVTEPSGPENLRVDSWRWGTSNATVSGLHHLGGETVTALVDGVPQTGLSVSAGVVTLATAGTRVIVGLPYTCDMQSLPLAVEQAPDPALKYERAVKAAIRVHETAGLKIGTAFDDLQSLVGADPEDWSDTSTLRSEIAIETLNGRYEEETHLCVRQDSALWATILNWTVELDGEE